MGFGRTVVARLFTTLFLRGIGGIACVALLVSGVAALAQTSLSVALGSTSSVQTASVTLTGGGTLSSILVLTEGVNNQDFQLSSYSCLPGTSYSAGKVCTIGYTFAPKYAGLRHGGISLLDNGGDILGMAYISGIGTGPQIAIYPTPSSFPAGTRVAFTAPSEPQFLAIDGAGTIYFYTRNSSTENAAIVKATLNGDGSYTQNTIWTFNGVGSGPGGGVTGLAVDGLGNVYYTLACSIVQLVPYKTGYAANVVLQNSLKCEGYSYEGDLLDPVALAIDANGALYTGTSGYGYFKYPYSGTGYSAGSTIAVSYNPSDIFVDGSANMYASEGGGDGLPAIIEAFQTGANGTYNEEYCCSEGFFPPYNDQGNNYSLFLDPNGSMIYGLGVLSPGIRKLHHDGTAISLITNMSYVITTLRMDAQGDIFFITGDSSNNIYEIPATPTVAFGSIASGTSTSQSFSIMNIGTATLTARSPGLQVASAPFGQSASGGDVPSDCGATFSLAPDGRCSLNLSFSPPSAANGSYSATLSVDDNTLSSSTAVQQIAVSGTAVHSPPTITSISPSQGGASGGSSFVITGTYLGDVSRVTFSTCYGSFTQSFTINSTTQITTTSALGCPSSTGTITIANPGGTATTTWTYNPQASGSNSSLLLSAPSIAQDGTATLTATVKDTSGNPIANALVSFSSSVAGIASAPSVATNSSGVATATVTGLIPGSTVITAQASGVSIAQTVALTVTDASVAVGSSLTGQQGVLTITTAGTLSSALALSQGASNTDFTLTANSCQAGIAYAVGATCSVTYTASPKAPGLRTGAIVMENSSGAPLGTLYLSVIGMGPQALFSPGAQSVVSSQSSVVQAVVDGLGNVYYIANGQIMKLAGGTTTSLAFSDAPGGLTMDGAGNLFYTDTYYRKVYELVNATGAAQVVATFSSSSILSGSIAADALGNLYVTDSGTIYKLASGTFVTSTIATGIVAPSGMVVDSSGNIYFSEFSQSIISEVVGGTSNAVSISTGVFHPSSLAIDAAGNLYAVSLASLVRLAAGSRSTSVIATNAATFESVWITGNGTFWAATSAGIIELNRAASAAVVSANLGSASAPQVITVENDGNTSLTLAGLATTAPFSLDGGTTSCTATTTLPADATCSLGIVFTPSGIGAATGTTTIKDNGLNVAGTIQTISLSGTGYGTQTINFPQPVTPTLPGTTATLTATASSGLPITYSVLSGPATVSGSAITYTDSGTVIISASQAGNASYAPASSVSVTVIVGGLNTAVGTTGYAQSIQVTISSAGTLQTINALTQGASNLDYKYVTGSTDPNACKVGTVYAANAVCTVQYSFTPSRPGQRLGAISLTSTVASVMGTALLSGTGTGAMVIFPGSTAISTIETGLTSTTPTAIAVDGNGDMFFANATGALSKAIAVNGVVTASSQVVAVGSTILQPQYIAVDGAGDVFVTDLFNGTNSAGTVTEVVAVNGVVNSTSPVVIVADNLSYPEGVAVDGSGDIFVSVSFDNVVKEIVAVNGKVSTGSTVNTVSSGLSQPEGLAVDASGDVFVAVPSYEAVVEIVAVNGLVSPSSTTKYFNSGFYDPFGVAVDGSGNVFVADPGSQAASTLGQGAALKEIVAVNGAVSLSSTVITLGGGFQARGVALDGLGHVFVADTNSGTDKELDLTVAPTLAFVSGSAALSTTVQNVGNAALTFTGLATSSSNFALDTTATTCSVGTPLVADGLCAVGADFTPQISGALTGSFNLTDNSLGIAGNQQQVPLTGTRGTTAQTITFPQPTTPVANGSAPVTLTATSTSGIPVTYSVVSGPATVSGTTLVYSGAGTVVVEADQVGNAAYTAAAPVQRTIAVVAVTNYAAPTTAVGGTSATQTATVTLPAGGTLGVITVVTQGTQNLDFALVSGGTCLSGAVFAAEQSCTVNYSFTPTAPGARQGAVLIYSNATTPAVLATAFLAGTGTSPLAVFSQGVQSRFASVAYPNDAAFDGAGNLYVSDLTSNTLDKITPTGALSQLVTGITSIAGVGVDGAGNVFYASSSGSNISELVGATGTPSVVIGASDPDNSLVFDATGNFYVELNNNGAIWKYNPEANTGSLILQGSTYGIGRVIGMTQDAGGDLYLADFSHSSVYELKTGATAPILLTSVGLSSPDGIAVDPAGNLYVSNYGASATNGISSLVKIPAGCTTTSCQTVLATGFSASFTKIDSSGNLYVGDLTDGAVVKITRTTTATLSYAPTPVNTSSAQQVVTMENDGTSSLSFSAITGSNANSGGAATTCSTSTPLTSAATCSLGVRFAPTLPTTASGNLTLTDNALNNSSSTQVISLIGASSNNAQTVTFGQPVTPVVPGSTAVLTATASSGLPVTFAVQSGSASINTVAGVSTITYGPGSGAVSITASQAGNSTYSAATSVSHTVTVAAAAVVTFTQPASPVLVESSAALVASSTQSATPIVFTVVSGAATISGSSITYSGAGNVVIAASQAGTAAYPAAATISQSVSVVRITSATALTVTAAGNPITATTSGTVVTLKATVLAGSSPMPLGQVNFCDGTPCTFSHFLGTAQVVQSGSALGTASFRYSPGLGAHSFTAVFVQTNTDAFSASAPAVLNVTNTNPNTVTTLGVSGSVGYYTLTGNVTGSLAAAPSGTLQFLDTTNSNVQVGSAPLVAGASTFSNSKSMLSGVVNYPQGMAVGDFNNDGILDLATANVANTTATVFLGTGQGQYSSIGQYASGSYCYSIAVADFNGDGNADMAVDCTGEVTILLGNGDGTFVEGTPVLVQTDAYSSGIATGDFNGDGIADFAITDTHAENGPYPGNSITIFLGKGDGTFTQGTSPATGTGTLSYGSGPYAIVVSDFNGDGILDLGVLNQDTNNVVILLGNGDGTFTVQAVSPSTGQSPTSIAVGDFNGDGIADLAVAAGTFSTQLTVLQGKGDGTFTPLASPNLGTQAPFFIGTGDLDGDGYTDLATTNYDITSGNMTVSVLHGNGDGTFAAPVTSIANTPGGQQYYPGGIVVADLNGDGLADVAEAAADEYDGNTTNDLGAIFLSAVSTTATATATGISPTGTGTHNVDAAFLAEGNYTSSVSTPIALTAFTRLTKTITFPALVSNVTLGSIATLGATASNGDPVIYSITSGISTLSGTTITYSAIGVVTITASSVASSTYNAATSVSQTINVQPATPLVFITGGGGVASLNAFGAVTTTATSGGATGLAVDATGHVWSLNGNSLAEFSPAGVLATSFAPTGLNSASALAIDGNSNIVVANGNGVISVVSSAGVAVSTTAGSTTSAPSSVAIDSSGNVWVANPTANTVDEVIGAAAPASPLVNAVVTATPGVKP